MNKSKYEHVSLEEREKIWMWRNQEQPLSYHEIGRRIMRSHSTVIRELQRHSKYLKEYIPCKAHERAKRVAHNQRSKARLKSPKLYLYVRTKLREGLSSTPKIE